MVYRLRLVFAQLLILIVSIAVFSPVQPVNGQANVGFADPAFNRLWNRTDAPVVSGRTSRSFLWGPKPLTAGIMEDYVEATGGKRLVQYFDKTRMEITRPGVDSSGPYYVTNGLLARELISGLLQLGDNKFEARDPSGNNVAGDADDNSGPTYKAFNGLLGATANRTGTGVSTVMDRFGAIKANDELARKYTLNYAYFEPVTGHNVASPFWSFLNQTGPVVNRQGVTVNERLFEGIFYATGLPVTEAYWARVKVSGELKDVLVQAFERRVLTYTPSNPAAYQVEMGNVGLHYYTWRYGKAPVAGVTRTYFIAADEIVWDYAPSGKDLIKNVPLSTIDNKGRKNLKAKYREYTDATYTSLKPVAPEWEHLGILGPVIRAEVGDTIKVTFKNNTRVPASIHAHGVQYNKDSEGAPYEDGTSGADKADDNVAPGATYVYTWAVPERAGPTQQDPSSIVWLYHSHVDEMADVHSGMMGPIIISRQGSTGPDGKPLDVDREFVNLYFILNESLSHYADYNFKTYGSEGPRFAINGYIFGNLPKITAKQGERVRWYLFGLGDQIDMHTVHWHGTTVVNRNSRTDVVPLAPAVMTVADMVADNPGIWIQHCHVSDHMMGGMQSLFTILPT